MIKKERGDTGMRVVYVHHRLPKTNLQSVSGDSPEDEGQGGYEGSDEKADPDGASEEEFLDVGFADAKGTEGSGFGLPEED